MPRLMILKCTSACRHSNNILQGHKFPHVQTCHLSMLLSYISLHLNAYAFAREELVCLHICAYIYAYIYLCSHTHAKTSSVIFASDPFFSHIQQREKIAECAMLETYAAGELVMRVGDPIDNVYIIYSGKVRSYEYEHDDFLQEDQQALAEALQLVRASKQAVSRSKPSRTSSPESAALARDTGANSHVTGSCSIPHAHAHAHAHGKDSTDGMKQAAVTPAVMKRGPAGSSEASQFVGSAGAGKNIRSLAQLQSDFRFLGSMQNSSIARAPSIQPTHASAPNAQQASEAASARAQAYANFLQRSSETCAQVQAGRTQGTDKDEKTGLKAKDGRGNSKAALRQKNLRSREGARKQGEMMQVGHDYA